MACALALAACDQPPSPSEALHHEVVLGDQCFVVVTRRPEDCAGQPPCIYYDMVLRVGGAGAGRFEVVAESAGHEQQRTRTNPSEFSTADEVALGVSEMLAGVGVGIPAEQTCIAIWADQNLTIADVAAVQRAVGARVRYVQLAAELADDEP